MHMLQLEIPPFFSFYLFIYIWKEENSLAIQNYEEKKRNTIPKEIIEGIIN